MTEGRAYELGSHRWHTECFKCVKCGDQLTAKSSMLVLGDGSPVCKNCSYVCVSCNKRIADMAVLTNDLSFCMDCFVCRNCKKRIDDLQYARTSQGIFCMACHHALIARKKQRQQMRQQQGQQGQQINGGGTPRTLQSENRSRSNSYQNPTIQNSSHQSTSHSILHHYSNDSHSSTSTPATTPSHEADGLAIPADAARASKRSSASTMASVDRNKALPNPPESHSSSGNAASTNSVPSSAGAADLAKPSMPTSNPSATNSTSSLNKKEPRPMRVARKQLAPSAFQNSESNLAAPQDSTDSLSLEMKKLNTDDSIGQMSFDSQGKADQTGGGDQSKTEEWGQVRTPVKTPRRGDGSNPSSAHGSGNLLNIPDRSQLRPISPTRSGRSSPNLDHETSSPPPMSSSSNMGTPVAATAKTLKGPPPPLPLDKPLDRHLLSSPSPTQAAAPVHTPRSPFNRFWTKRDGVTMSPGGSGLQSGSAVASPESGASRDTPLSSHKRSLSENTAALLGGRSSPENEVGAVLTDALRALANERQKNADLEKQLKSLSQNQKDPKQQHSEIDALSSELSRLQSEVKQAKAEVKQVKEEYQMWATRAAHQRHVLEEMQQQSSFASSSSTSGGQQQPLPPHLTHDHSMPNLNSSAFSTSKDGFGSSKKDDFLHNQSSSISQAQFLPLKNAKQWLFRRPNKPGQSSSSSSSYGNQHHQGPQSTNSSNGNTSANGSSYLSNNYSTDLSGDTADLYAGKPHANGGGAGTSKHQTNGRGTGSTSPDSILGESLSYRAKMDQCDVPIFVTKCFQEIESRALDTEGLYRKPGSKSQVDAILEEFGPMGNKEAGDELLKGEIQTVTSAVKQYLRRLAEPVITYDCYDAFIAAGNSKNIHYLRKAITSLPSENYNTLKAVVDHLVVVASHQDTNLMNVRNLAMVFAPTLAREESGDREVTDMQARNEAMQMLITDHNTVFDSADELL